MIFFFIYINKYSNIEYQSLASIYKAYISLEYFSFITFLFNFIVGVSSPPSIENSTGRIENFWIVCALEIALELAAAIPSSIIFLKFSH